jgi:hypothetical protein
MLVISRREFLKTFRVFSAVGRGQADNNPEEEQQNLLK